MSGKGMGFHTGMQLTTLPYHVNPTYRRHQMETMEKPSKEFEELFEKVDVYGKSTFELAKLKALEIATTVVTSLVAKLVVSIPVIMFLIVLNIGLSIYLGEQLRSPYFGYFIVALLNLVITVLLYLFIYPLIRKSLSQVMIKQALE